MRGRSRPRACRWCPRWATRLISRLRISLPICARPPGSAAAELLTQAFVVSRATVAEASRRAAWLVRRRLGDWAADVAEMERRLAWLHPRRQLADRFQRLDEAVVALGRLARRGLLEQRQRYRTAGRRWLAARPPPRCRCAAERCWNPDAGSRSPSARGWPDSANDWGSHGFTAIAVPDNILDRGYSITFLEKTGKVIRSPQEVSAGDRLRTRSKAAWCRRWSRRPIDGWGWDSPPGAAGSLLVFPKVSSINLPMSLLTLFAAVADTNAVVAKVAAPAPAGAANFGVMFWVLTLVSAAALAVVVERVLYFHRVQIDSAQFLAGVRNVLPPRQRD